MSDVRVLFVERDNAPERLVCEAEILFEGGILDGLKLVGFSLWRSPEGEIYVTFPSRAFGTGSDRRFFDFLRSHEGGIADSKRVKAWIAEQFKARVENPPCEYCNAPRTVEHECGGTRGEAAEARRVEADHR